MEEDIPPLLEPDTLTPACPNLSRRRMYRLCSTEHIPPLPDTQLKPAPTSQDPEPHCWPGPSPSLGPRGMEGADFMEPISPKPNTQTENSITDPDTLVLIHPPQGPVAPHRPCPSHKRIHGVGIGISVGPMEPIPPHSNTQASVTDPDTLNLIQETRQITHKNDTVEDNVTDCHCDTHVLMLVTQDPVTGLLNHHHHHHHVRTEKEDMAQSEGLEPGYHDATPPPVDAYWVLCDSITSVTHDGTEGASLKRSEENNDSPNELWLDACQYQTLAAEDGEGEEGAILGGDEWGLYPIRGSGVTECPDNTKESGSLLGTEAAIGQGGCDSDQGLSVPPFDRSVSTDSWYSTFSDWAVIVPGGGPRPEDFTGTAALTQKQGQAQAYPQTPMAIQHQAVEPRASPESPILAGPEELLVVGSLQDREGEGEDTQTEESHSGCISSAGQGDQEPVGELVIIEDDCSAYPTDSHSTLGSLSDTLASPTTKLYGLVINTTEAVLAPPPISFSSSASGAAPVGRDVLEMETDIDISHKRDSYLLEDSVGRFQNQHLRDAVQNVTENSLSQLGGLFIEGEDEERSYGSVSVSGYPSSSKAHQVEHLCGDKRHQQSFKKFQCTTDSDKNTYVPAHRDTTSRGIKADIHVSPNTDRKDLQETEGKRPQWGNPPFLMPVMPLAPLGLSVGRSLFCRTNSALEGDTVQASPKRSLLNEQRGQSCGFIQSNVPRLPVLPACFRGKIDKKTPVVNKEEKLLLTKTKRNTGSRDTTSEDKDKLTICSGQNLNRDIPASSSSSEESTASWSLDRKKTITVPHEVSSLGKELSSYIIVTGDHLMISEKERVAYFTLDQENPLDSRTSLLKQIQSDRNKEPNHCVTADVKKGSKMPHKTRTHSKKDKPAVVHHLAPPTSKTQENLPLESNIKCDPLTTREDGDDGPVTVKETIVITENVNTKGHAHGKKKKHSGKHSQNASVKSEGIDSLVEVENRAKQKTATNGKIDTFVAKFGAKAGKTKDKTIAALPCKDSVHSDSAQKQPGVKSLVDASVISQGATVSDPSSKVPQSTIPIGQQPNDDVIKRRRLSEDKFGKHEPKAAVETTRRKAYSDVLKQRTHHAPKEVPRVVQRIQAVPVSGDPQSLSLGCQFTAVFTDYTVTWTRDGTVLAEIKRSAGDESRVCLTITKASNKDLGKYRCSLLCSHGSVILDYLLTYEVLSDIVILANPQKNITAAPTELVGEEEDVKCSCLLFKEDFLSEQYFDKNQPASLVTEKEHFGEGMHRRAFRTRLKAGMVPVFTQGHHCVLKVHNAISYGTQNNEELVQKNYNLAVEECHVQNTAREYIKVWTAVAQTQDAFGEVPEIIPIYLVHRPSNDIPYATLEEELMGEFVKYSVRDGKEINLKRNDSEAGQKCCTFQHWVYHKTEGNLLVTDMQGVGMRLTDVGIATCKKGYKGFKGNCATSFIDQFKALHLCNKYCEILGLKSLQPKPKKTVVPKPKPTQPVTKTKKTIGPTLKSKS
ncbi:alpha-protein kinase 2 [Oncorhynchus kisutch]|uniref:non-specific serine/threonine protein kinase n=1 Tax=Oncorhynchus kisutch TaxID=8019 RepID=A0A8C7IIS3_ONCKI|nr:alpha-protein kinase 2 [Oncorhynchus kisutch]